MTKVNALKCLICLLFAVGSVLGHAQVPAGTENNGDAKTLPLPRAVSDADQYRLHFGFLGGINIPEGSRGATPEVGMDFGFQPYIPYGAGVELTTSNFGGDQKDLHKRTTFLFKGSYNFGGDTPVIKFAYVGLGMGPTFLKSGTEMAVAPLLGFDFPFHGETHHQEWSLGFYAKYMFVTTDDPDSLITLASLKYWF